MTGASFRHSCEIVACSPPVKATRTLSTPALSQPPPFAVTRTLSGELPSPPLPLLITQAERASDAARANRRVGDIRASGGSDGCVARGIQAQIGAVIEALSRAVVVEAPSAVRAGAPLPHKPRGGWAV